MPYSNVLCYFAWAMVGAITVVYLANYIWSDERYDVSFLTNPHTFPLHAPEMPHSGNSSLPIQSDEELFIVDNPILVSH